LSNINNPKKSKSGTHEDDLDVAVALGPQVVVSLGGAEGRHVRHFLPIRVKLIIERYDIITTFVKKYSC
jgi:hypothetical protein